MTSTTADSHASSPPAPPLMERVKSVAAVLAAVAGALTGMWGIYEKVRSEARKDTAASYNTLAPQVNQLGEALKELQRENHQLREIVATRQGQPRLAEVPPRKAKAKPTSAAAATPAAPGARPVDPNPTVPHTAAGPAPTTAAPTTAESTAAAAGQPAAPSPAEPSTPAPGEQPAADPVTGLINTVGRARDAIEGLRKVPEDFGRVLEKRAN